LINVVYNHVAMLCWLSQHATDVLVQYRVPDYIRIS